MNIVVYNQGSVDKNKYRFQKKKHDDNAKLLITYGSGYIVRQEFKLSSGETIPLGLL